MSYLTTKMNQNSIEINGNLYKIFLKFGMVELFETLQTVSNVKMNIFRTKNILWDYSSSIYNLQFYQL